MFTRDIERMARSLMAQKVSKDYLRHYLCETFQLDDKTINQVLEKIGAIGPQAANPGAKSAKGPTTKDQPNDRRSRQGFF